MGKVYVIISGKGGVGKTTSAINLGSAFNKLGKETVVVDGNLSTPNVGLHLGSPIVPVTLNHVMENEARVEDAIYQHESGMKILPSSLALSELKRAEYSRLIDIAKRLRKIADYIIMDAAAGLGEEVRIAIKASDEVIVVTNPEMPAVVDALKSIKLAEQMKKNVAGCVITRCTGARHEMSIPAISDMLEKNILGIIPEDKAVKESHYLKSPVVHTHPRSRAAKAYNQIIKKLLGPEYFQLQAKKTEGFFKKLLRKIGFKNNS